jgi:hypothetical protein
MPCSLFPDMVPGTACVATVPHGSKLHVDVLRGFTLTPRVSRSFCERPSCDALVSRHWLGTATHPHTHLCWCTGIKSR